MNRALVVFALGLAAAPAAARSQLGTLPTGMPYGHELSGPALIVARIANAFEVQLVRPELIERVVRWHLGMRDLAQGVSNRLAAYAERVGVRIPDLTVLTTDPVSALLAKGPSSGFGWRDDPVNHNRKYHRGSDIRADHGTPVVAAGDGVVVFCGRQSGYGNVIYVDHGGGVVTRYAHLRRIETKKDAAILAGQRIGQVGSTGRATGPHLHFEVRLDGRAVNPNTALSVAELERETPSAGQLAAFALAPEVQDAAESDIDPPKHRASTASKSKGSRPERTGHVKRVRPLS